jgi:branched-chain amino acid transport system permease protein
MVFPEVGIIFALLAYVTVAMGGFGSLIGALIAGVAIGVIEAVGAMVFAPAFKYGIIFLCYLIVVMIRPKGLFGRF